MMFGNVAQGQWFCELELSAIIHIVLGAIAMNKFLKNLKRHSGTQLILTCASCTENVTLRQKEPVQSCFTGISKPCFESRAVTGLGVLFTSSPQFKG